MRALIRFLRWQIMSRLVPYPIVYPWVNHSKILAWKGLTGVTGNIYCGLHEYEDMAFVLHFLRPGDLFVDVGANVGAYSILAGSTGAEVIAVEPIAKTYTILNQNIILNDFPQKIEALNLGLSNSEGWLNFTDTLDTVNHVVSSDTPGSQRVPVKMMDTICDGKNPGVIKIDVEGYEQQVLEGGTHTLDCPSLKALIVELNGSSLQYGVAEEAILDILNKKGFVKIQYEPSTRKISPAHVSHKGNNGLFVRDIDFVQERLETSNDFLI